MKLQIEMPVLAPNSGFLERKQMVVVVVEAVVVH